MKYCSSSISTLVFLLCVWSHAANGDSIPATNTPFGESGPSVHVSQKTTPMYAGGPTDVLAKHNQGCGTTLSPEEAQAALDLLEDGTWEKARNFLRSRERDDRGEVQFAMTIHIVRYSDGSGGIPQSMVDDCIDILNDRMASTDITFIQEGSTRLIDSDTLASFDRFTEFCLIAENNVPNTMNIYFVPESPGICGVASFPNSTCQAVVMNNFCSDPVFNDSTFPHEVGHYLNLYHTHTTFNGSECVDGSNCASAGDMLCDTPADPLLSGVVDFNTCEYLGDSLDACGSGIPYNPDTANIMSYSTKLCRDYFSEDQLSVMTYTAFNVRANHLRDPSVPTGACCIANGCFTQTASNCDEAGGEYLGDGTTCDEEPCGSGPSILIVDGGGSGNFTDIQTAIDFASNGDEIIVYPGNYRGVGFSAIDTMGKAIWIHSSEGPETTFIEGQDARRGIICENGENPNTIIEGFTIRNCSAPLYDLFGDGNPGELQLGGGILVRDSSPAIVSCIFENNVAAGNGYGSGIFTASIDGACNPSFTDCLITGNSGLTGGGAYVYAGSLKMVGCTISQNTVTSVSGGGLFIDNASVTLTDTDVCGNSPDQIYGSWTNGGGTTIEDICPSTGGCCLGNDCTIETANDCDAFGGTYIGNSTNCDGNPCSSGPTTWTVALSGPADFNSIQDAVDAAYDGDEIIVSPGTYTSSQADHVVDLQGKKIRLVSSEGPEVTIINGEGSRRGIVCFNGESQQTVIDGFTVTQCLGIEYDFNMNGGIEWWEICGGALYCRESSPTIDNCIFSGNNGNFAGGAIYWESGQASISNCLITGNQAEYGGGFTGFSNSSQAFINCDISSNNAPTGGGLYFQDCNITTMTNCLVTQNSGMGGILNLFSDTPMTLLDTTVCENEEYQIQGGWTDNGGSTVEDICPSCTGDATGDGVIDVNDALYVISSWNTPDPNADFDGDGLVDTDDILILLSQFGVVCE